MEVSNREVFIGLVSGIDRYYYRLNGHHQRVASLVYEVGKKMYFHDEALTDLVIAATMHDYGSFSSDEYEEFYKIDSDKLDKHAIKGSVVLRGFPKFYEVSDLVKYHHVRWENREILMDTRTFIISICDRLDMFRTSGELSSKEVDYIKFIANERKGKQFSPGVVDALIEVVSDLDKLNEALKRPIRELLETVIPDNYFDESDEELFAMLKMFSSIVDYKSPYSISHSFEVSEIAYELSKVIGLSEKDSKLLKVSGLLHDWKSCTSI
jgi:HD-GYP domain-containing protein (c-di-GMP phosphodiesterase class II)